MAALACSTKVGATFQKERSMTRLPIDTMTTKERDAWWSRRMELLVWFGPYIQTGSLTDLKSGIRIAQAAAAAPSRQ